MTKKYARAVNSIEKRSSTKDAAVHSHPAMAAGIKTRPGENKMAARFRGVREFSGNTQAKTTNEYCIISAITKLAAIHHSAPMDSSWKFQKMRSFVFHAARNAMKAANIWFARLRGFATNT